MKYLILQKKIMNQNIMYHAGIKKNILGLDLQHIHILITQDILILKIWTTIFVRVGNSGDKQTITIHEKQNKADKMKEYMLLALRKIEGVKISDFKNKFIDNPVYLYREELNKLACEELIEIDIDNIKLTNKGIDLANLVWEEFV